jgi:hypothetical protein
MWIAATALVCALGVLNRSEASLPRIEIVDQAPAFVSAGAEAFVQRNPDIIFLIASSAVVRDAAGERGECGDLFAVKKLASILIHEEAHLRYGDNEERAYYRQLITLIQLGLGPESRIYRDVHKSMRAVLQARKRNRPDLVLATR